MVEKLTGKKVWVGRVLSGLASPDRLHRGRDLSHWRVGDPVYVHIGLGVLVWLGLYLREGRLTELLPLRKL